MVACLPTLPARSRSVALDPRQSVPDEEVGRLVREMRLAEATLGAASDGTGSRTTSGQSGSQVTVPVASRPR